MKRKRLLRLASLIIAVNMTFGMIPGFVMADETDASEDEDTSIEITFDEEEASDEIAGDEDAIDAEVDDETDADVAEAEDVAEASDEEEAIADEDAVEDIAEPEEDAAVEEETASVELTFDEDDAAPAEEAEEVDAEPAEEAEAEADAEPAEEAEADAEAVEVEEEVVTVEADDVSTLTLNATNVPDKTLRDYLITLSGGDTSFTQAEMSAVTMFELDGDGAKKVANLKGLDKCNFTACKTVTMKNNSFTGTFSGAPFPALESLYLEGTPITGLNLSTNTYIKKIDCQAKKGEGCKITNELDLHDKIYLEELDITWNEVGTLDVSGCTSLHKAKLDNNPLQKLYCSYTLVGAIEVKSGKLDTLYADNCPNLNEVIVKQGKLRDIDLTNSENIEILTLPGNELEEIDLTTVIGLSEVDLSDNQLLSINLSQNIHLKVLDLSANPNLKKLSLTNNKALETLNFQETQISSITVTQCTSLNELRCYSCKLSALDLSRNTALRYLDCHDNTIKTLNLANNTKLAEVYCQENQITSISVANMENLEILNCAENKLTNLSVTGCEKLRSLEYKSNPDMKTVDLHGCIVLKKFAPSGMTKLVSVNLADCKAITDITVPNNSELKTLNVAGCINVQTLNCAGGKLTTLDVSGMTALKTLKCSSNQIKSLNLKNCTLLDTLECSDNKISSLDLSKCNRIKTVRCDKNQITTINLSGAVDLKILVVSDNTGLKSLDVSGKTRLETLTAENTGLTSLNASGLDSLKTLNLSNCASLKTLNASGDLSLTTVNLANDLKLTSANFSGCKGLKSLSLKQLDSLKTLNVSNCTKLARLTCSDDALETLTLTGCTALEELDCSNNNLHKLNISDCEVLEEINCSNNKLATLDANGCTDIISINCSRNILTSIKVNKCPNLKTLVCEYNQLESINLSKNKNLATVNLNHNLFALNPEDTTDLEAANIQTSGRDINNFRYLDQDIPLLRAEAKNASRINLSWTKVAQSGTYESPVAYTVYMSTTRNGSYTKIYDDASNSFAATGLEPNKTYYFQVRAVFADGKFSEWSAVVKCTTLNGDPTPTPKPGHGSDNRGSSTSSETGIAGFVERLYTVALGRQSDPNGKADWINRVRTQGYTGADLARGFLFSDEFLGKNMGNAEFLDVLYETFFNREADDQKANWLKLMDSGWSKKQVIDGFINSTEWANLCLTFGVASGSTFAPNITVAPSQDVIDFATRLYTTCLGRNADQAGLDDWASQLANMKISGSEAAHGFFFSGEFIDAGYSNAEYVTRLYRTFMGREPDQAGFDNWMAALASGQSREFVFQGFAGSAEWAGICADYGILK